MRATGIGSLPGTDVVEAVKATLGELPDLPYLPELPARGPGADLIGRTAGFLVDLPVELYAGQWRIASRPGQDLRRALDLVERDLDALTEQAAGYAGPLKVQAAGPWTLAAAVDLPIGGRMLRDPGAVRDLTESLAEGLRTHVAEVARRVPGAQVVLQLDEPTLPTVLSGQVPTESGWQTLRAVDEATARTGLSTVVDAVGVPVVGHCCAAGVPITLFIQAGCAGVGLDLDIGGTLDPIGEAVDAGRVLYAGAVPTVDGAVSSKAAADRIRTLWRRLGFPVERMREQVVVTPACGLAGASPDRARRVIAATREAARRLAEED